MLNLPIIAIRKGKERIFLKESEILFCSAADAYTNIHLVSSSKTPLLTAITLKEMEHQLSPLGFYRIHQKYLINMAYLSTIHLENNEVKLVNGEVVKIAFARRKAFLEQFFNM